VFGGNDSSPLWPGCEGMDLVCFCSVHVYEIGAVHTPEHDSMFACFYRVHQRLSSFFFCSCTGLIRDRDVTRITAYLPRDLGRWYRGLVDNSCP
jgi:hypothetical protein